MGNFSTVILAGGYGTRLGELGRRTAKPLLKLGDWCLLDYIVDKVCEIDTHSSAFVLVNSQFLPQYQDWISEHERAARLSLVNNQKSEDETAPDIIANIVQTILREEITTDLLIVGGDNLFDFSLRDFVTFGRKRGISTVIMDAGSPSEAERFSVVTLDSDGRILQLLEKPKAPLSTLVTTCIYWFPATALSYFHEFARHRTSANSFGEFMQWLIDQAPMYGFLAEGKWYDVGTLDTYNTVRSQFSASFPLKGSNVLLRKPLGLPEDIRKDFEVLRGVLQVQQDLPEQPGAVIVCGSDLVHVADAAANVYKEYLAKNRRIVFVVAGGRGRLTPPGWSSEAEVFGARMVERGVPRSQIMLETESGTMTSNFRNAKRHLELKQICISSLIVLTDDVQLRRAVLTAEKEFSGVQITGCAPGYFDLDRAPEGWPADEWRQRLLWIAVNEIGRLVKYQIENTAEFAPFAVSKGQMEAAIRIGRHLMGDRSVPRRAKSHLDMWLTALNGACSDLRGLESRTLA